MRQTLLLAAVMTGLAVPAMAQMPGRDPVAVFDAADANHDGRVSRDEFRAARSARFAGMDRNGDGVISRDDFATLLKFRPQAAPRIDAMFTQADANHDGKVTPAELAAAPTVIFDKIDINHDGYVDKAELAAARAMFQQMKQGN